MKKPIELLSVVSLFSGIIAISVPGGFTIGLMALGAAFVSSVVSNSI